MSTSNNFAIRFVLAGSCHPFSGRQVMFLVPADSTLSLGEVISNYVQPNWPVKDLPDLQDKLQLEHLRVLKMGKVLTMESPLFEAFSAEEKKQALEVGKRSESGDQALIAGGDSDHSEANSRISGAVLMHLFFRPQPLQIDTGRDGKSSPEKGKPEKVENSETVEQGCCAIM